MSQDANVFQTGNVRGKSISPSVGDRDYKQVAVESEGVDVGDWGTRGPGLNFHLLGLFMWYLK